MSELRMTNQFVWLFIISMVQDWIRKRLWGCV